VFLTYRSACLSIAGTTYTQPQNINAKSVQKPKPSERREVISRSSSSSHSWPSISAEPADEVVDHRGGGKPAKCAKNCQKAKAKWAKWRTQLKPHHQAHRAVQHKEARQRQRRETEEDELDAVLRAPSSTSTSTAVATTVQATSSSSSATRSSVINETKAKRPRSTLHLAPEDMQPKPKEPVIIIDDVEEFDSGTSTSDLIARKSREEAEEEEDEGPLEPRVLPLRPVPPNPYEAEEMSVVYAEQHSEIKLMCEVDLDIATSMWYKNGQVSWASGQFLPKSLPLVYSLISCEEPLSCQKLPTCADFNCILSLLHSFAHFPSLFFVFPSVCLTLCPSVCLSVWGWLVGCLAGSLAPPGFIPILAETSRVAGLLLCV